MKKLEQSRTINLDLGKLNELAQGATKGDEDGASGFNLIASASAAQKDVRIGSVFYESGFIERQLITRAFANDDVGAEFEALKQREIEDDLPTDSGPVSLPGWGSWAGEGKWGWMRVEAVGLFDDSLCRGCLKAIAQRH